MLDPIDRDAIVTVILEAMANEVVKPLERLFDCLLFELMARDSIDYSRFAGRLEELWSTMPEAEKESSGGQLYERYLRVMQILRDDPQRWLSYGQSTDGQTPTVPDWFRGVIAGGATGSPGDDDQVP